MITFILIAVGAIVVIAMVLVAYGANQRKRAGQSGAPVARSQQTSAASPSVGRPTGIN